MLEILIHNQEFMAAVGIILAVIIAYVTKNKITENQIKILWNAIENLISNAKSLPKSGAEKQSYVVDELVKQGVPKKARKTLNKLTKEYGSIGNVVNLVYNQRKILFKFGKKIGRVI
jgi:hypothetical protein